MKKLFIGVMCFCIAQLSTAADSWQVVGTAGFSPGNAQYTSLAFNGLVPYVAFSDYNSSDKTTVMSFDGNSWSVVGSAGFSAGTAEHQSLAFYNGEPYVAYMDIGTSYKATVMKYSSGSWSTVGSAGFSAGTAVYTSLAFSASGEAHVAYRDVSNSYKATVMKYSSGSWSTVGSAGFSADRAKYVSLAFDVDTAYVAYSDTAYSNKMTVMKFNGTSWVTVGSAGFSAGAAQIGGTSCLAILDGTPYVAYGDQANSGKTTVMKFNGTSWENVGSVGFSSGSSTYHSIDFDQDDVPYVAYKDAGNSNKTTVMKYISGSWSNVGSAGFSAGTSIYQSLAFDSNGIAHVAYRDEANSYATTVMKFDCDSSLSTYIIKVDDLIYDEQTVTPSNNPTTFVHVYATPKTVSGASEYYAQVSSDALFSTDVRNETTSTIFYFQYLCPDTQYYIRAKSDQDDCYGHIRTFTTDTLSVTKANLIRYLDEYSSYAYAAISPSTVPTVATDASIRVDPRPDGGPYYIEISTDSDFSVPGNITAKSATTHDAWGTLYFEDLNTCTTYYVRATYAGGSCDLAEDNDYWGRTLEFNTDDGSNDAEYCVSARPSGIESVSLEYDLVVLPTGFVINSNQTEVVSLKIMDINGQLVYEDQHYTTNTSVAPNMSNSKGMYLVQVVNGNKVQTFKTVKY